MLTTPTTKSQRSHFATLDETAQSAMADFATSLYDGTRTVSECWKTTFIHFTGKKV